MRNRVSQNVRPDEPSLISGRWYNPYQRSSSAIWSLADYVGYVHLAPIVIPDDTRVRTLAIRTVLAESVNATIALYRSNDLGMPQSLAVSGTVSLSGTHGVKSVNVDAMLPQGLYWAGMFSAGTSAHVRACTIDAHAAARYLGYADDSVVTPAAAIELPYTDAVNTIDVSLATYTTVAPPQIMVRVA